MKTILKGDLLIVVPEGDDEAQALAAWKALHDGHVLLVAANAGTGVALKDLGRREDACREPINVTSRSPDESVRLIGNFAATPFALDGRAYASVESFWQGLKFDGLERRRVAELSGPAARHAGDEKGYGAKVSYEGSSIAVGTRDHWDLMERACRAKFAQNADARAALLATSDRPLVHRTRHDSRTIPGAIMAEIWMKLRSELQAAGGTAPSL
jgi:predicted NAD-dependent protein-ADP-ribosyltransferase YbiA (DUF1768 family)